MKNFTSMTRVEPVSHRKATALLIDDHQLIRTGLRLTLQMSARIGEIFESGSIQEAISSEAKQAYAGGIDLVLLDIMMPGLNGLDGLAVIQSAFPSAKVVMVSAAGDSAVVRDAAERGASGFILKSSASADISRAVDTVLAGGWFFPEEAQARLRGGCGLTPR